MIQILVAEGYIQPQELKGLLCQYLEEVENEDEERIIAKILTRDHLLPEVKLKEAGEQAAGEQKSLYEVLKENGQLDDSLQAQLNQKIKEEMLKEIDRWQGHFIFLSDSTWKEGEVKRALSQFKAYGLPSLLSWLVLKKYVTQEEWNTAWEERQKTGRSMVFTLLETGYLTPEEAEKAMRSYGQFGQFIAQSLDEWRIHFIDRYDDWWAFTIAWAPFTLHGW